MRLLHFAGPLHFRIPPEQLHISDEDLHSWLPSWVPNWNPKSIRSTLFHNHFEAGTCLVVGVDIDDDASILRVSGICIDSIAEVEYFEHVPGTMQAGGLRYARELSLSSVVDVKKFYDVYMCRAPYFDGEDSLSAFARTIVLDCSDDGDKRTLKATDGQPPFAGL